MPEEIDRRDTTVLQAVLDLTKQLNDTESNLSKQVGKLQTELAVNTNETKNVVTRLDKLNGSVAKHETSIGLLEQAQALHTQTINALTKQDDSTRREKRGWLDWLLKGIVVLLLLLFYSLLTHAGIVSNFLRPIP